MVAMMTLLFRDYTKGIIEALLFVATDAISLANICRIAEIETADALELLTELQKEYQMESRGLQLQKLAAGWQLTTKPKFAPYVERLYKRKTTAAISQAALETLAIVAYRQPVSRAELELIRGVNSDSSLNTLLERELIEEKGRRNAPGRPVLYGTTKMFLKHFGFREISELPALDNLCSQKEVKR